MTGLDDVRKRAESDAKTYGYFLTPDPELLLDLLEGLMKNEERYGYPSCPCRLASGVFELDRDIICPCDYRDPDVKEYGFCYCALYVRQDVHDGKKGVEPIPERRPIEKQERAVGLPEVQGKRPRKVAEPEASSNVELKLYYCKQCGYVCFREDPPYICPICKAKQEMFEELKVELNGG